MRPPTIFFAVACLVLGGSSQTALAAEAPSAAAALVNKMPADAIPDGQQTVAEIVRLGPPAIREIVKMLAPPGEGNDAKARFALQGLAFYVTRPGAETERAMVAGVLIERLESPANPWVKIFLVNLLQLAGKEESVAPLGKLLGEPALCEPAAQALVCIRGPGAAAVLIKALPAAKGPNLVTILRALGELRAKEAVDVLLPYATSESPNTRRVALFALANIGDPRAANALATAAQATTPYERAHATALYLRFAGRLAESGDTTTCARICREIIKTRTAPRENNAVCDALATLVSAVGAEAAGDLVAAMDSENPALREAALQLALTLPGETMTARLVSKMKRSAPEPRAALLRALGRRGDKAALPAVLDALKDTEKAVRLAAVDAAARFATPEVVAALLAALNVSQGDEIQIIRDALTRVPGDAVPAAVAAAMPQAPPAARAALIQVLATRDAKAHSDIFLAAAEDKSPAVRAAALKALSVLAEVKALPRLIDLALKAPDDSVRADVLKAVVATCEKNADPEGRAEPILAAMGQATGAARPAFLKALAQLGGQKALAAVRADARSTEAAVQDAAIRALADWRDAGAAADLLALAKTSEKQTHQVLALRGYVRLVGLPSDRPAAKTTEMYQEALAAAKRPDEKRLALSGLSAIHSIEALKAVAEYLDDAALGAEAAMAAVKIAQPQRGKEPPLQGAEATEILKKVAAVAKDANVRAQAEAYLKGESKPKAAKSKPKAMNAPRPKTESAPAPAAPPAPPPAPDAEGFVPLFNGKDLTGWIGSIKGYAVEDGVLVCRKEGGGKLLTEKEYSDFVIRFEFKLTPGANNGLGIRAPVPGDAAYNGMEIQILDDTADMYKNLQPYQYHGSIYGVAPAERGHLKPVGEWNVEEVAAKGPHITVKLNGATIVDADIEKASTPETLDHKAHPGLKNTKGHIGFLGHGARVEFRNIRLKELPPEPPAK